jgi:hypothetical protein
MPGVARVVLALLAVAKATAFTFAVSRTYPVARRPLTLAATSSEVNTAALLAKLESLEAELKTIKAALTAGGSGALPAAAANAAYVARGRAALESR